MPVSSCFVKFLTPHDAEGLASTSKPTEGAAAHVEGKTAFVDGVASEQTVVGGQSWMEELQGKNPTKY